MSTPVNSNTFRHFPDLPIELRLAIWELYILSSGSQGRVVNVQIKRTVSLKSNTIQKGNSALDDKETISTWAASTLSTHDEGLATNALRVCRESRKAFMERNPDMIGMVSGTKVHFVSHTHLSFRLHLLALLGDYRPPSALPSFTNS
ncbi:hypothetical protein BDZ45DRAFT_253973 [Acephala macrosclerotiorum]|nr:hypothetical protein BDZ45DRAFT_253973 [Acephala macrosclerotiorum]